MSDNEMEADVSFLPGPGHGGTGKRNVYEPDPSQRCKQLVCSKRTAVIIVTLLCIIIIGIALIAAFARPSESICYEGVSPTHSPHVEESTPATATNGERFPWENIRLPSSIIPSDYDISLHPNLTNFGFIGNVTIQIKVLRDTNFIVFHARDLNFSHYELVTLNNDKRSLNNDKRVEIVKTLHYPRHQQVYLELEHDLREGKEYLLKLSFSGMLSDNMAGFYKSSYTTSKGERRWLATTQFEPVDARAAFPCFDEPSMKAYFSLSMIRDKDHITLFNMPKIHTESLENGLFQDRFQKSVRMSTYLVAFVVCDFAHLNTTTGDGKTVSVYTPPEQIQQAEFALNAAKGILEHYESFFGIKYPLPKQDLIAIPDFGPGAMENWGLITYRMSTLLFEPTVSTDRDKESVAIVIAHELAHQWFGNLVTMKWWNDLWLNEGFASFVEYIGSDHVNPEWKMMDQFITIALIPALQLDSLSNSHPVSVTVEDPGEIGELFDTISYNKGASIIRMLEGFIGRDKLQTGLRQYLGKYKYSNAQTNDLWNSLSQVAGLDVKKVMDTWTLQMGYPVVTLTRKEGSTYIAEQSPFLLNPNSEHSKEYNSPFGYKWEVPLTYVTDTNPRATQSIVWMQKGSAMVNTPVDTRWIKANVNMTGFYRVHYDKNNWEQLSQQLRLDHTVLTSADRAGLIDDAFSLAAAGHMQASQALDLIQYLVKEKDFLPWKVALAQLQFVMVHIQDLPVYQDFKVFFNTLLESLLMRLGWQDTGSYLDRQLRVDVLTKAVIYNHPQTVRKAKALFDDWMVNKTQVDPKIKQAIYRAGIQHGGRKEWDFCWDQYQKTNVPSEKHHLLYALAMTTDATQLNRYLYMSLESEKIRSQDAISVIGAVSLSSSAGKTLAWSFVKRQWATIMRRFSGSAFKIPNLINKVPAGLTTEYDLNEVRNFFEANPVPSATRAVAQALEKIQMRIDWISRNKNDITEWTNKWIEEHNKELSENAKKKIR